MSPSSLKARKSNYVRLAAILGRGHPRRGSEYAGVSDACCVRQLRVSRHNWKQSPLFPIDVWGALVRKITTWDQDFSEWRVLRPVGRGAFPKPPALLQPAKFHKLSSPRGTG